jgi:hypothetical protein
VWRTTQGDDTAVQKGRGGLAQDIPLVAFLHLRHHICSRAEPVEDPHGDGATTQQGKGGRGTFNEGLENAGNVDNAEVGLRVVVFDRRGQDDRGREDLAALKLQQGCAPEAEWAPLSLFPTPPFVLSARRELAPAWRVSEWSSVTISRRAWVRSRMVASCSSFVRLPVAAAVARLADRRSEEEEEGAVLMLAGRQRG